MFSGPKKYLIIFIWHEQAHSFIAEEDSEWLNTENSPDRKQSYGINLQIAQTTKKGLLDEPIWIKHPVHDYLVIDIPFVFIYKIHNTTTFRGSVIPDTKYLCLENQKPCQSDRHFSF